MSGPMTGTFPPGFLWGVTTGAHQTEGNNLAVFALPNGDYNLNGSIDTGDYAAWRKSIGGTLGYSAWRQRYGAAGSGSGSGTGCAPGIACGSGTAG